MLINTLQGTGLAHNEDLSNPNGEYCPGQETMIFSPQGVYQAPYKVPRTLKKEHSVLDTKAFTKKKDNIDSN